MEDIFVLRAKVIPRTIVKQGYKD